jgi:predicted membrane protein
MLFSCIVHHVVNASVIVGPSHYLCYYWFITLLMLFIVRHVVGGGASCCIVGVIVGCHLVSVVLVCYQSKDAKIKTRLEINYFHC